MITAAQHQIWLWTYSINLTNLFGYHIDFTIFSHLWSLAVEEHFYALWPLVIFLVSPARIALVPVGCLIGCFLLRCALVLASSDVHFIYAFTLTRLDGLVLGAAIAIAIHNQIVSARTMRTVKFIAWASAASVVPLFLRYGTYFIAPVAIVFGYSLLALFFGSILLTVVTARSGMMMKVLATPFLRSFGKYSYCLYVIHYPLQPRVLNAVYFRQLETRWSIAPAVIVSIILDVAVMFLLSMGIWHLYEKHFVRLKHRFAPTSSEVAS
jgi:peptidoglycan/LPS O-acetylase OafA/YrhL